MREFGLHQQLTYWPPAGTNRYGQRTYGTPAILQGRWEDRNEEVQTIGGQKIVSQSIVYTESDVGVNGYLAQGDHTATADPTLVVGAHEIRAFNRIPDLRNVSVDRKAVL
jgi:hypothetical protein